MFMVMHMKGSMASDFFRLCTVHKLPGTSQALSWESLTLQISHHEPVVTHAVIALAAIHRSQAPPRCASDSPGTTPPADLVSEQVDFALDQYRKAVSHLRSYIAALSEPTNAQVEVVLLLTLLFFCFDVLRVEDESAGAHLYTGLKVLCERLQCIAIREGGDSQRHVLDLRTLPHTNLDLLAQTFVRLDADLTLHTGQDHALLLPGCDVPIPKLFSSIDEATVHLDALGGELMEILFAITNVGRPVLAEEYDTSATDEDTVECYLNAMTRRLALPNDLSTQIHLFKPDCQKWMSAYAQLRQKKEDEPAHILASINFFLIWFTITNLQIASEMGYDSHHAQLIHMVDFCERYLSLGKPRGRADCHTTRPAFTTGTHILAVLFEVASKCRDSNIRQRCVSLCRTTNMAGVFDGEFIASLLGHQICLEETRARPITGDWTTRRHPGRGPTTGQRPMSGPGEWHQHEQYLQTRSWKACICYISRHRHGTVKVRLE